MKKFIKFSFLFTAATFVLFYAILAGNLWWSEHQTPENLHRHSLQVNSLAPHEFILINSGLESLKRRILAFESAQKTIELEYFIFELDLAAQIISFKLIEAAKRGVKVKILVDSSAPVFKLTPEYAKLLSDKNIEVKYYNTSPLSSIINVQHRSHRKLLIIDSQKLITGGRNIGNDYFDLSEHYNFIDSDVEVTGPIVKEVQKSFYSYWNSEYASLPDMLKEKVNLDFIDQEKIAKVLRWIMKNDFQSKVFICNDVDFVTDSPGVDFRNRKIWPYLVKKLNSITKSLNVESPYFVLRTDGLRLMTDLAQRNVQQTYLTNSLFSTDAYYTVSAMVSTLDDLRKLKVNMNLFNGEHSPQISNFPIKQSDRWGLHAKRAVLDRRHTIIGTYNIDPRSANLNSEVIISCNNNSQIAKVTLDSMEQRSKNSWKLFQKEKSSLYSLTNKASLIQVIKFYAILPLARLFNFLL